MSSIKKLTKSKSFVLIVVWILVTVIFALINNNFLKGDSIRNTLYNCSLSGMLAIGISCVLISGNCDLSTAGVGCMAGCIVAVLMEDGMAWIPASLIGLVFGACAGLINAFLVYKCKMMPFIATLSMASIWRGLAYIITGNYSVVIADEDFWVMGSFRVAGIPLPFIILVVLFIIYGYILSRTNFGRKIYMMGGNRQSARLAGIKSERIGTILFVNCSMLSALGGIIFASRMHNGSPTSVNGTELEAITAAVLGGVAFSGGSGGMFGCFCGLLLMNTFNDGLNIAGLTAYWQMLANGLMLILALILDYFNNQRLVKKV